MNRYSRLLSFFILLSAACSSQPSEHLSLLPSKQEQLSFEEERLRKMQMVRVVDETGQTHEWDTDTAITAFSGDCFHLDGQFGNCNFNTQRAKGAYCVGEIMMGMAGLTPSATSVSMADDQGKPHTYTVPPQSAAVNAELAEDAFAYFHFSVQIATDVLNECSAVDLAVPFQPAAGGDPDDSNLSAIIGSIFRDAYRAGVAANAGAVSNTLAVSDAQQAGAPSLQLALARSFSGTALSRAAAAHLLLGGVDGFAGDVTQAQCKNPRLSGPARRALEIFRQAGVSPQDVLADDTTVDTDALVNGIDIGAPAGGSVRQRLGYFENITVPTNQTVWDFYGLARSDFEQARQTLKDEITVFSRSLTAQLSDVTGNEGTLPTYHQKYAATASPPTERDAVYWMALALTESRDPSILQGGSWHPFEGADSAPTYLPRACGFSRCEEPSNRLSTTLSEFVDFGHSWANYFLSAPSLQSSNPSIQAAIDKDILAPLGTLAVSADRGGRVMQCNEQQSPGVFVTEITALGYSPDSGLILVQGEDNLECATRGTVEGAPCGTTRISLDPDHGVSDNSGYSFSQGAQFVVDTADLFPGGKTARWYLLTPRQPGNIQPGNGGYKAIAGFVPYMQPPTSTGPMCRDIPIVPDAIEGAEKAFATSPAWCGSPSYECDGVRFDDRLPLEDELTSDSDGVESSWKHYLALAHTAADQADALGQAYINAGQAVDENAQAVSLREEAQQEKAAAELETLQSICGTAVDTSLLLQAMGTTDGQANLNNLLGPPCTQSDPPVTGDGYLCVNTRRVLDWRQKLHSSPILKPLADCLASFDDTMEVGLGSTTLCKASDSVTLGQSDSCDNACPTAGSVCVPKEQSLDFFDSPSSYPPLAPNVCDAVRVLRKTPGNQAALDTLISSKYFTTSNVRALGQATDIHLDYGGFVTVHAGGASYSTGSPGTTPSGSGPWPCGPAQGVDCTNGAGLFCQSWDCSMIDQRAQANQRLYQAVLAAKLLTWADGSPVPVIEAPAFLEKSVGPSGEAVQHPGNTEVEGIAVDTWSNDRWRMFDPDLNQIPDGSPARCAVTIGAPPGSSCIDVVQPGFYVAIERQTLDQGSNNLVPTLLNFWGGMSPGASATTGGRYIERALMGEDWSVVPETGFSLADNRGRPRSLGSEIPTTCRLPFNTSLTTCPFDDLARHDFGVYGLGHGPGSGDGTIPQATIDGTQYAFAGHTLLTSFEANAPESKDAVLDSLELFCDGMNNSTDSIVPGGNCNGGHVPPLDSVKDLDNLGAYMECLGDDITRRMVTTLFEDVPTVVVDGLIHSGKANKAGGGELDTAVSNMREALDTISSSGPSIGGTIHRFGQDVRALRAQLKAFDISDHIDDVQLNAQKANQITSCLSSVADAAAAAGPDPTHPAAGPAGIAKAAVTCANSAAQIGFAVQTDQLQKDANTADRDKAIAEFSGRFGDYVTSLQTLSGQLGTAVEHVVGALSVIEGLKAKADRSVDNALWLLSEQAAKQGEIAAVLSNVRDGTRIRYERALSNAKRTASLARRSIEQRLGVSMDEMVDDLPLVSAPATWASTVCTTSGINFQALEQSSGTVTDPQGNVVSKQAQSFADAFIGDYVNKLDQVVESYRLKNSFHEGTDTAVVSLRDDIDATRAECDVTSRNILLNASNFNRASADAASAGWVVAGCTLETIGSSLDPSTRSLPNCITASRTTEAPFLERELVASPLLGYEVTFGNGTSSCTGCGWNAGAALQQTVSLAAGRYRLSWYTKDSDGAAGFVPDSSSNDRYTTAPETNAAGVAKTSTGAVLQAIDKLSGFIPGTHGDWNRAYFVFDVTTADSISIAFKYPGNGNYTISVAAPMLEKLDDPVGAASTFEPQSFSDTGDTRTSRSAVCEDTDGAVFREKKWQRACAMLCPDGYASDCRDRAQQECYWETSFNINQNGIDTGSLFGASGFARGNFNYRVDTIGLNFVGTGLRNCADSSLPTTCNAAGFVPYSIYHEGPYFVRNHKGEDFQSFLFTAAIEHARGLGTERYLTNPMSQTDSALLQPYLRQEFQGRPLDGDFVIRVWDADGLDFNALQDVQVVLNYRYWTRLN